VIEPPELVEEPVAAVSTVGASDGGSPNHRDGDESLWAGSDPVRRTVPSSESRRPKGRSPRLDRLLFLIALSLLGVALVAFLVNWLLRRSPSPTVTTASPSVVVPTVRPLTPALPQVSPSPTVSATGTLNTEGAETIVKNWLTAKAAAMGETRAVDQLPKVLTGGALEQWQKWAADDKANNAYIKYEHGTVAVNSVQMSPDNPDLATVEATVSEKKESFSNGKPEGSGAPIELQIRYTLVRQDGNWLIQAIEQF
jgi:cytoskeletal protein RodZ